MEGNLCMFVSLLILRDFLIWVKIKKDWMTEEVSLSALDCLPKPRLSGQQLKISTAWCFTQFHRKILITAHCPMSRRWGGLFTLWGHEMEEEMPLLLVRTKTHTAFVVLLPCQSWTEHVFFCMTFSGDFYSTLSSYIIKIPGNALGLELEITKGNQLWHNM